MSADEPGISPSSGKPGKPLVSLAIFLGLGPPLGMVLTFLAFGAYPITGALFLSGLAPAYFLGLIPALLAWGLDRRLVASGRSWFVRVAALFVAGAAASGLLLVPLALAGLIHGYGPLLIVLVGAATAFVCVGIHVVVQRFLPEVTWR